MLIREATVDDFEQLMGLYRQLQPSDPVLTDGADLTVFYEIVATPKLYLFVAEQDAQLIGSVYLNIIPNMTRSAAPYAVVENVITAEAFRGRGVGKALMRYTLAFAWAHGCYKAMLQTGSKEPSTHAFYRACGFSSDEKTGYLARPST